MQPTTSLLQLCQPNFITFLLLVVLIHCRAAQKHLGVWGKSSFGVPLGQVSTPAQPIIKSHDDLLFSGRKKEKNETHDIQTVSYTHLQL